MRLSHSLALARMLLRFFGRRVLRVGVLRSTAVRVMVVLALVALAGATVAAGYVFLKPMVTQDRVWSLLFEMSTVSVVLWVQIAFLFVKVLFINADGMLDLSHHLPLTNRERAVAFLVYEATMVAIVALAGFVSLLVSSVLLLGPAAVPQVLESIIFPMVLTYLALTVLYLLLGRALALVGLRRIGHVVLILALFGLLLTYSSQLGALTADVTEPFLDGDAGFVWVGALSFVARTSGSLVMLGVFLAAAALLVVLALWLTPNENVQRARFVKVPVGRLLRPLLRPYDLCLIRSSQTWLAVAVSCATFVTLCLRPTVNPMWALAVLSMGGLYQYAATAPLRMFVADRSTAWQIYVRLARSQLILFAVFALPALAFLAAVDRDALLESPPAVAGCLAGSLVALCIGIVFPAENDNPFSVFVGLSVAAAVLGLCGIAMGVLQLPPPVLLACVIVLMSTVIWYSVQGIQVNESRRRNEEVTHAGQRRRGGRTADPGHGGREPALSDVRGG